MKISNYIKYLFLCVFVGFTSCETDQDEIIELQTTISQTDNVAIKKITNGESIPKGWVITEEKDDIKTIQNTYRFGFGHSINVTFDSPVPLGWVITKKNSGNMRITALVGATLGARIDIVKPFTYYKGIGSGNSPFILVKSSIPSGWVIIKNDRNNYTLQYVSGSSFSQKIDIINPHSHYVGEHSGGDSNYILIQSPIPVGWAIVKKNRGNYTIRQLIGAPFAQKIDIINPHSHYVGEHSGGDSIYILIQSPIPVGWAIVKKNRGNYTIRQLIGAPFAQKIDIINPHSHYVGEHSGGDSIYILVQSPIPVGWAIIKKNRGNYTIRQLSGAPFGQLINTIKPHDLYIGEHSGSDSIYILIESPIPVGWIIIKTERNHQTIQNLLY